MQVSTILLYALWRSKRTLQTSYTLCGGQTGLFKHLQGPYIHALQWSKRTSKPPTRFAIVKISSPNFYKPPTCIAIVKTDPPSFYKSPTRFSVAKTYLGAFASFLYALRLSKRTLCTCTIKPPTRIAEVKTGSPNAFWGSINGLSEQLQASYTLCGIQNWLYELQRG